MTYQVHIRQGDETIKYSATPTEVEQIKKAQMEGRAGVWVQGEYHSLGSIRSITKDTETKVEPVSNFLQLPDEDPEAQRVRIRQRLNEMRQRLNKTLSKNDRPA